jgi:syntaxin 8
MTSALHSLEETVEVLPTKEDDDRLDSPTVFTPYSDNPDLERGQSNEEMLQMQRQMMDDQDQHLTHLSTSLNRTHHLSLAINGELEDHSLLLDGLEDDLNQTDTRMATARRRLDRVAHGIKGNGTCHLL